MEEGGNDEGRPTMTRVAASQVGQRLSQLDNLRAFLVAWIIGGHALLGYAAIGGWPYDEVHESTFHPSTERALAAVLGPSALFVIGTFFFIAGLFVEPALERKGPARFAGDRLLRLGVPFLAFALLLWPLFMWLAYQAAGQRVSYWWWFTHRQPFLDSGQMWFAEVLLYVSLGYLVWQWFARRRAPDINLTPVPLGLAHLAALAAGMAVAAFVVRLWFPARSTQVLDLHLWQLPQCVGMFGFGVAARRRGWHAEVPFRLYRIARVTVAITVLAVPVLAVRMRVSDLTKDGAPYLGGWHWRALLLASIEAVLVVMGSVWLLGLAQRRFTAEGRWSASLRRASYAAFALQAPVLLALSTAARGLDWPAEAKAVMVAVLGVSGSFWLGTHLVRTRLGRIV